MTAAACDGAISDHETTAGPGEESDTEGDTDTGTSDATTGDDPTTDAASTGDAPGDTHGGPHTTIAGPGDVNAPFVAGQ